MAHTGHQGDFRTLRLSNSPTPLSPLKIWLCGAVESNKGDYVQFRTGKNRTQGQAAFQNENTPYHSTPYPRYTFRKRPANWKEIFGAVLTSETRLGASWGYDNALREIPTQDTDRTVSLRRFAAKLTYVKSCPPKCSQKCRMHHSQHCDPARILNVQTCGIHQPNEKVVSGSHRCRGRNGKPRSFPNGV